MLRQTRVFRKEDLWKKNMHTYNTLHLYKEVFLPVVSTQQRVRKASWDADWRESFILEPGWALRVSDRATCWSFILLFPPLLPSLWAFHTRNFPHSTFHLHCQGIKVKMSGHPFCGWFRKIFDYKRDFYLVHSMHYIIRDIVPTAIHRNFATEMTDGLFF